MKLYYQTAQPDVIFDTEAGFGFTKTIQVEAPGGMQTVNSRQYQKFLDEVQAGTSQILPWPTDTYADKRRMAYGFQGLSADNWLEAIVEFLGTLKNPPAKFAELWAKREATRLAFPKS